MSKMTRQNRYKDNRPIESILKKQSVSPYGEAYEVNRGKRDGKEGPYGVDVEIGFVSFGHDGVSLNDAMFFIQESIKEEGVEAITGLELYRCFEEDDPDDLETLISWHREQ